jgi:hypothetical protein
MLLDVPWARHCVIVDSRLHLAGGACAINALSSCDTKQALQDGTIKLPDFLIFSLVLVETESWDEWNRSISPDFPFIIGPSAHTFSEVGDSIRPGRLQYLAIMYIVWICSDFYTNEQMFWRVKSERNA